MKLQDRDYKEIFALFSSSTRAEKEQMYDEHSDHFYENIDLNETYDLSMEYREFAIDAWRAVITFLKRRGFNLLKDEKILSLDFIDDEFIDA